MDHQQWFFSNYLEGGFHCTYLTTPLLAGNEWEDMDALHNYVLSLRDRVPIFSLLFKDVNPKRGIACGLFRWTLFASEPAESLKDVYKEVLKTVMRMTNHTNQCVMYIEFTDNKFKFSTKDE